MYIYPVRNVTDVKVEVKVEGVEESLVGKSTCERCCEKARLSGIIDVVTSLNWAEIQSVEKIVRL